MVLTLLLLGCPVVTDSEFAARLDADGDGYRSDAFADGDDCDDATASVHPGLAETWYNSVDDDCDAATKDDDQDGDGYPSVSMGGSDCDDTDLAVHPGAVERCDQVDGDCDGSIEGETDADGDGSCVMDGDCDDTDPGAHPRAVEECDAANRDEDCDGAADDLDTDPFGRTTMYQDLDGDAYGVDTVTSSRCDTTAGWAADAGDCDDADANVHPDTLERCNGYDDDCNDLIDAADPDVDPSEGRWYLDYDRDGFGWVFEARASCEAQSGYVHDSTDCDDLDSGVHPSANEVCNAHDDNCDGLSDDEDPAVDLTTATVWYVDADGDRYGDASLPDLACAPDAGFVAASTDCDDGNAAVNPGAIEACNGVEDNCDGVLLDGLETDTDADGYRTCSGDCDDATATTYTGATDDWYDGVDANCDSADDYDQDADGHEAEPWGSDCADEDRSINPGMVDTWYDGVDTNCDGADDYDQDADGARPLVWGGDDCDDVDAAAYTGNAETWYDGRDGDCSGGSDYDQDEDGYDSDGFGGEDCEDEDSTLSPGEDEVASDRLDNNCDGLVDGLYDVDADVQVVVAETETGPGGGLSWGGDVDGDGGDDLLVGMVYPDGAVLYVVSVASGGETDLADSITTYTHSDPGDVAYTFGSAFGDDDGDGLREVAITAGGQVYLIELGGTGEVDLEAEAIAVETGTGSATLGMRLGDVDGDGLEDLAVADNTARDWDRGYNYAGKVTLILDPLDRQSGTAGDGSGAIVYWGQNHSYFGNVAPAGDLDGDGLADTFLGPAYCSSAGGYGALLPGGGSLVGGRTFEYPDELVFMWGDDGSDQVCMGIGAGDIDGDGADDAVLINYAEQRILIGPVGPTIGFDDGVAPMVAWSYSGRPGIGDFNGDGTVDLAVNQASMVARPAACVFLTNPTIGTSCLDADLLLEPTQTGGFGVGLFDGSIGDGNGDGYSDLAIGSGSTSLQTHAAWVLYGRP